MKARIVLLFLFIISSIHRRTHAEVIVSSVSAGSKCQFPDGATGRCEPLRQCLPNDGGVFRRNNTIIRCSPSSPMPYVCCRKPDQIAEKICSTWRPYWAFRSSEAHRCVAEDPLIIGGETARPGEFPNMAIIGQVIHVPNYEWFCGGTLISPTFVLTAAHCFKNTVQLVVGLGVHDMSKRSSSRVKVLDSGHPEGIENEPLLDSETNIEEEESWAAAEQFIEVAELYKHPNFFYDERAGYFNDIALLRLENPAVLTERVLPACLSLKFSRSHGGAPTNTLETRFTAAGWGKTDPNKRNFPSLLQKVHISYYHPLECLAIFQSLAPGEAKKTVQVPVDAICAGDIGKDTCKGDSGGPLMDEPYAKCDPRRVSGITSYGPGCKGIGAYTKVAAYLDWVTAIVAPATIQN